MNVTKTTKLMPMPELLARLREPSVNLSIHAEIAPGVWCQFEADPKDADQQIRTEAATQRHYEENPVAGFYADFDESTNTVIIGRCMTDTEAK